MIGKTIKSLKKGMGNISYEIIVADGRSTDATRQIVKKEGATVVMLKIKKNISTGKNYGASFAKGEYIAFLDADITIKHPEAFFNKALKHFEDDPDLTGLGCSIRVLPELETRSDFFFRTMYNVFNTVLNNYLQFGTGAGEFQMVKRTSFEKVGGFNENLVAGEDNDFFFRLAKIGHTRFDPSLVVYEIGRRAHQVGWIRLYLQWLFNGISVLMFKKSPYKNWDPIR
ncbi:glycosyltransferase [Candidatus Woesebacteria bacterium]|nr:glycosyltransferase [Candidatus Woesebacteria bacterium]